MKIPTTDRHIVIEAHQDPDGEWVYRAVTPALGWHDAQAEWDRLDDLRRGGMIQGVTLQNTHFMVRANDDPRWIHLGRPIARHDHHNTTSGRFTSGRERAAKDYASSVGVKGGKGGWIYGPRAGRPAICQGWATYASRASRHLRQLRLTDGTTADWALTEPFAPEAGSSEAFIAAAAR